MKVILKKVGSSAEESAVISAVKVTESISSAVALLESGENAIAGYKDGDYYPCPISAIYYIEATDDKTFAYTRDDCLEIRSRLYELESGQLDSRFFRCSKSMICNLRKIKSVCAEENSRMVATLLNDEKIVINRSYVKDLKKRLGI